MKLKKLIILAMVLIIGNFLLIFSQQLDLLNLKGIKDIIIFMDVNGVSYRRGYHSIKDQEPKDFNLENVEKQLNSDGIPLKIEYFKKLYLSGVKTFKESHIRVKEIYNGELSIIPFLTISLEIKNADESLFAVLVQLIVSDRIWIHSGDEKKSTAYIWLKKKWTFVKLVDLEGSIQEMVDRMISGFIDDCKKIKSKK